MWAVLSFANKDPETRRVGYQQPMSWLYRVARFLSIFIQNLSRGVGRFFVKLHRRRVEIFGWARRKGEVTKSIFATYERRRVPLTDHLFRSGGHVVE